jgi:hypothetical protein
MYRAEVRRVLAALAVVLFLVTGCGARVKTGTVIERKYDPPYSYVIMMCSVYNSKGICMGYYPWTQYEPERYELQLRNGDNAKVRTGWIDVPKELWAQYPVGRVYP